MKKIKLVINWLIEPMLSRVFWYKLLFITICVVLNAIVSKFINIPYMWMVGWIQCLIYCMIFPFKN